MKNTNQKRLYIVLYPMFGLFERSNPNHNPKIKIRLNHFSSKKTNNINVNPFLHPIFKSK